MATAKEVKLFLLEPLVRFFNSSRHPDLDMVSNDLELTARDLDLTDLEKACGKLKMDRSSFPPMKDFYKALRTQKLIKEQGRQARAIKIESIEPTEDEDVALRRVKSWGEELADRADKHGYLSTLVEYARSHEVAPTEQDLKRCAKRSKEIDDMCRGTHWWHMREIMKASIKQRLDALT